ncbi:hypothetical protein JL721_7206 [Aureococcus anophagefferens]|nr:hypothetical protein JL721_7206 [Aureococcus anophagefferens]
MPLHILTAIALLSAAHQGIKVAASSSNLGAPSSKTAATPKKRFLRSSASAQDLVKSKEPVQLDKVAHAQESLVALSGDSSSSDVEGAASLKDRFLRVSTSAQDLLAVKESVQLDDVAHGQESLVALSGDSPSSDVEAAASLKGRFLRSSTQDILASRHPFMHSNWYNTDEKQAERVVVCDFAAVAYHVLSKVETDASKLLGGQYAVMARETRAFVERFERVGAELVFVVGRTATGKDRLKHGHAAHTLASKAIHEARAVELVAAGRADAAAAHSKKALAPMKNGAVVDALLDLAAEGRVEVLFGDDEDDPGVAYEARRWRLGPLGDTDMVAYRYEAADRSRASSSSRISTGRLQASRSCTRRPRSWRQRSDSSATAPARRS